ncbi:unnamed protein product [Polarella glacialis]|uniref:Peptidase A1 domain-containing protein n=1 Tax=Polarella glacialis TaxID=89957 RepID=A0A813HRB2_POLGL|nr:unnamed protein product [Polarella glacialis]
MLRCWCMALVALDRASIDGADAVTELLTLPLQEYVSLFDRPTHEGKGRMPLHVTEYYGKVLMGDPPQEFGLVFDTGSGNIVLPTIKCGDEACEDHHRFSSSASHSAIQVALEDGTVLAPGDERDTTTITYGTGKLTGEYIRDRMCLRSDQANDRIVRPGDMCIQVDFLGVTQESRFPFSELPFDGIFGLGLGGLSAGPSFNFVSRLVASNESVVRKPVFAFFLRNLNADEDSEITFGGYKPDRVTGGDSGLTWLPVPKDEADEKGYWIVTMRDIYVRGVPLGICNDSNSHPRCQVAMDTGTALMMGPRHSVNQLLRAVGGCSQPIPSIRFELDAVGGGTFSLVLDQEDFAEVQGTDCAFAFQPVDLPPNLGSMWVLGQTALRKYYSVYDAERWQVGIGLARHTETSRESALSQFQSSQSMQTTHALEVCEDDNNNMVWSHLPGCKRFFRLLHALLTLSA